GARRPRPAQPFPATAESLSYPSDASGLPVRGKRLPAHRPAGAADASGPAPAERLRAAGRPGACPTVSGAVRTGLADQPHRPRSQEHAVMKRLVALALLALSLNVHAATEVL